MNPLKTVHVVSSRPRKDVQFQIGPADVAQVVLERAGLDPNQYYLIKPGDQTEFGMDESVFPHVADGGKLNVVPQSDVGATDVF